MEVAGDAQKFGNGVAMRGGLKGLDDRLPLQTLPSSLSFNWSFPVLPTAYGVSENPASFMDTA